MNQLGLFKNKVTLNDFCASFEQTVVDVITTKTLKAAKKYNPKTVVFGGGVSANKKLRETLETILKKEIPNSKFLIPNSVYSMDNAAMIAVASYHHALKKEFTPWQELIADPNWKIYE